MKALRTPPNTHRQPTDRNRLPVLEAAFLALAFVSLSGCASSRAAVHQSWLEQPSKRTAVLSFSGARPYADDLAEALVTELVNEDFPVMERTRLPNIMTEQRLQTSGVADPATAVELGGLAGVDYLVVGSLTTRWVVSPMDWFFGDGASREEIDTVCIHWVSVHTGQIVASVTVKNARGGDAAAVARRIARDLNRRVAMLQTGKEVWRNQTARLPS